MKMSSLAYSAFKLEWFKRYGNNRWCFHAFKILTESGHTIDGMIAILAKGLIDQWRNGMQK